MAKSFETLRGRMTPATQARARNKKVRMMKDMALHELRSARELTQGALAERLNLEQPAVSKLERRTDMYVSTLRRYIEAMGGELEIIAHFPEGNVRINQFEGLAQDQAQETMAR
jgi:transcriptional regulator with XRE-family HTH domain